MYTVVSLYSENVGEIARFLNKFYETNINETNMLTWEKKFKNPIEMTNIISTFIDNKSDFKINMWVSLDKNIYINVTEYNVNELIKYLYERFPY